jgi:alanine-synthesizing transaminase
LRENTASTWYTILAYADICFDGWKAPSIMQVQARATSRSGILHHVEGYNMAGWRIGFMVGNKDL